MKTGCKRAFAAILACALLFGMGAPAARAEEDTPGVVADASAFEFQNGTITGLTDAFIKSLTDEEKRHITLAFPDEIDGEPVTAIGASAFYAGQHSKYKGYGFTLDFSELTQLKTIENQAFLASGGTRLFGELVLPDTVESIGNKAFSNDGGLDDGLSGTLRIPESVRTLGTAAFSYQRGLTAVTFPEGFQADTLESTFRRCSGLTGVLRIPQSVKTLAGSAFSECGYDTVYLPEGIQITGSNVFFSCGSLRAIVCAQADYAAAYNALSSTAKALLTYPVEVSLDDGQGGVYPAYGRLYNKPLNFVCDADGSWGADKAFELPELPEADPGYLMKWAFSPTALTGVTGESKVAGTTLYAVKSLADPVISYSGGIDKEYDGLPSVVSVEASHPLYRPIGEADDGDVVFYYTWYWNTIGSSPAALAGFDKNSYDVGGVRAPFAIGCCVKVQACRVNGTKAVQFYVDTHDFTVDLRKGIPKVTLAVPDESFLLTDGLPDITKSEANVPGTFVWKDAPSLKLGENLLSWSFTPADTVNYEIVGGETYLYTHEAHSAEDVQDSVEQLPELHEGEEPSKEAAESILNTKLQYEALPEEEREALPIESHKALNEALMSLPQVTAETQGVGLAEPSTLLQNMSGKQTGAVLTDEDASYHIALTAEEATLAPTEQAVLEKAKGAAQVALTQEVTVAAELRRGGEVTEREELHSLQAPVRLVFEVPEDYRQAESGKQRKFSIVRLHAEGDGMQAAVLPDEDDDPATVTVSSKDFSVYAVVYEDTAQGGGGSSHSSGGGSAGKEEQPKPPTAQEQAADSSERLADITGHWAEAAMRNAVRQGWFTGTSETAFSPNETMTRAMLITVLYRMAGSPTAEAGDGAAFTDVDADSWYGGAVDWAVRETLVSGYSPEVFGPQDDMTREQLVTILYRYSGASAPAERQLPYADADTVSAWAADAVRWAVDAGILTGKEGNVLDPQGRATRAEVAVLLTRYQQRT